MQNQKLKITNKIISRLKPASKEYCIRDTDVGGFHIKVYPSGSSVYRIDARLGGSSGRLIHHKIGNVSEISLSEAREEAKVVKTLIGKGNDVAFDRKENLGNQKILSEILDEYLNVTSLKTSTEESYRQHIERNCKKWLKRPINQITEGQLMDWYVKGRSEAPTRTNTTFRYLRAILNYAVKRHYLNMNPCKVLQSAGIKTTPQRRHSLIDLDYELESFIGSLYSFKTIKYSQLTARDLILFMLTTGLRSREAKTLLWQDVDFKKKEFTVRDTKNKKDHTVQMAPLQFALLQHRRSCAGELNHTTPYVFPNKSGLKHISDARKTMKSLCETADIPVKTFHDLRRTFSSILNAIGVGFADHKTLMNHKTEEITVSYTTISRDKYQSHMRNVIEYIELKMDWSDKPEEVIQFTEFLTSDLYGYGDRCFHAKTLVNPSGDDWEEEYSNKLPSQEDINRWKNKN